MRSQRPWANVFVVLILGAVTLISGCAHTMGQATLSDGNVMEVYRTGEEVSMQWQCLTPETIKQLTGSEISNGAPKQACYTVVTVSAKSSNISKAVTQYVNSSADMNTLAAGFVPAIVAAKTPGAPKPVSAPASVATVSDGNTAISDYVNSIVVTAVTKDSGTVDSNAQTLSKSLSQDNKDQVRKQLNDLIAQTPAGSDLAKKLTTAQSHF